ncbi:hypothetical protein AB833_00575 [Chromatiales bacterium (ex Bugula neritina AB1)]|nr:hypothetical protein AB833_00575 [Chromatiales bacterium (ex Bugula neritina AB1)]
MSHPVQITEIVNIERYPIEDLTTRAADAVVAHCRDKPRSTGLCLPPEFIHSAAIKLIQSEARSCMNEAHYTEHWRATPIGDASNPDRSPAQETPRRHELYRL